MATQSAQERLRDALLATGLEPRQSAALLAETFAASLGGSLLGCGLRLFPDGAPEPEMAEQRLSFDLPIELVAELSPSQVLGEMYELLLSAGQRHSTGSHYTPAPVADGLVRATVQDWHRPPADDLVVLDPAAGAGAFLLAAARWRGEAVGSRRAICAELHGRDINATAVAVAEAALALWCLEGGESAVAVAGLCVGDVFTDDLPAADLIVGNPPFLNQLGASTARSESSATDVHNRFGVKLGPYADTAAVFVLAGLHALNPGGRLMLIQPISFLASRDVAPVRAAVGDAHTLVGMWFCDDDIFDASVRVCAPVVERDGATAAMVRRWAGADVEEVAPASAPVAKTWGPLVADMLGIPAFHAPASAPLLGDLVRTTAGFRDQFYGFVPVVREGSRGSAPLLVTTGMIDPLRNRWGSRPFRFAKRAWDHPVVDIGALDETDPTLLSWASSRLVPKVVVATQTKVIEAAVDVDGVWVPITPLLSVEPIEGSDFADQGEEGLWRLAALLSAPPLSALALAEQLGTALAVHAIKLAARQICDFPLPTDSGAWTEGADAARAAAGAQNSTDWLHAMDLLGRSMTAAYCAEADTFDWWIGRLPDFDRR